MSDFESTPLPVKKEHVGFLKRAAKFVVAAVAAVAVVLGVAGEAFEDDVITVGEAISIVAAIGGAIGVYAVPNKTED